MSSLLLDLSSDFSLPPDGVTKVYGVMFHLRDRSSEIGHPEGTELTDMVLINLTNNFYV